MIKGLGSVVEIKMHWVSMEETRQHLGQVKSLDSLSSSSRLFPVPDLKMDEKMNASSSSLPEAVKPATAAGPELISQVKLSVCL
jgi:hypothetical protein